MAERKRIYLCLAHMSDEGLEQKFIKEAFDTNWVVPLGPNVNAFEQELEAFVCSGSGLMVNGEGLKAGAANHEPCIMNHAPLTKRVVALSAGTAAVHLALIACGVALATRCVCRALRSVLHRTRLPTLVLLLCSLTQRKILGIWIQTC